MKKVRSVIFIAILIVGFTSTSNAQTSLTAENMALGGGGSAYLTGFEALFVNPANLYIREKNYRMQISVLQGGAYFDSMLPELNTSNRFRMYRRSQLPYTQQGENRAISDIEKQNILDQNFPGSRRLSTLQTQTDFYWFGMKWTQPDRSYAVALRTRSSSIYELGRGYFSSSPVERNGLFEVNQSFRHNYQSLHELSFGYAESFTFINGLIPRLSEFIVGIAPKVVIAGSYLDAVYTHNYNRSDDTGPWVRETEYSQKGSGYFYNDFNSILQNGSELGATGAALNDMLQPSGFGFGLDLGITYLITFGNDLSVLRGEDTPTEKSLRFSFSINDLGAIRYYRDAQQISSPFFEEESPTIGEESEHYFQGAPNEHISFLNQFDDSPFSQIDEFIDGSFNTLMPTTIHTGALFQINRLKLMGDISYSLSKNSFSANTPIAFVGVEVRPLSFLPLRAGTRLAPTLPGFYSFGTGIETSYFDVSAAIQLKSRSIGPTTEILAASLVGIKFYLP